MTDKTKKTVYVFAMPMAYIIGILSVAAASGIAPWQMMTRAEAQQADSQLADALERHEFRVAGKLDRVSEELARLSGAFESIKERGCGHDR